MIDTEMRVITFGSMFEETPEGLYRMDRIQRNYDAMLAEMSPLERTIFEDLDRDITRKFLGL